MSESRLFQPMKLGSIELKNRIAKAPMTRFCASDDHEILPMATQYYAQHASVPGTLLITEATIVSKQSGGYANVPGIYTEGQISAWKKVTNKVHKKRGFIYLQLWALGRVADRDFTEKNNITVKSSNATQLREGYAVPKEMTIKEIEQSVHEYAQAANNAIAAGFDGVEIHTANGYLIDQFLKDTCNKRTDQYGGSAENRSRFAIEVTQAVVDAVGADKTGIPLSPFSEFQGIKMTDPIPHFADTIRRLNKFGLAYLHLVETSISGSADVKGYGILNTLLPYYRGPLLIAGRYDSNTAKRLLEDHNDREIVVVFGQYFISNPDLVFRLPKGIEFSSYDRDSFYIPKTEKGYIDYPFSKEWKEVQAIL
ncbi:12-oxophytodienoate reductase 1 [Macroventuria anomochaeta]|uniref:12-oxophytodienoate reductase 1 n=1 Tax=Macroventuria anomochaeta TaxID=301207 RepID=A0ACB6RPF9_9PLEO|nr:12-oxophytodienoate reductase 1 [Macroventuria anomochaeta]KAF2623786.1 12-oxophytodienoate reductase 1 [Macroventuria anomochaeta]